MYSRWTLLRRPDVHRAELEVRELAHRLPKPRLAEEDRPRRVTLDRDRDRDHHRRREHERDGASYEVDRSLDHPAQTGDPRRAEPQERKALDGVDIRRRADHLEIPGHELDLDAERRQLPDQLEHLLMGVPRETRRSRGPPGGHARAAGPRRRSRGGAHRQSRAAAPSGRRRRIRPR